MKKTTAIPLLTALAACLGFGLYVAASAPTAALSATWTPPPASGCYVAADAYLVQWQGQTGTAGRDTVYTAAWSDYPPGVFRFRTAAFAFARDAQGNVVAWNIGRPLSGVGCAVTATDTLWSAWSGWATGGTPGRPGDPVFGAVLK